MQSAHCRLLLAVVSGYTGAGLARCDALSELFVMLGLSLPPVGLLWEGLKENLGLDGYFGLEGRWYGLVG